MKLLFAVSPLVGHVNPLLAIAGLAAARGDEIIFTTAASFQRKVEAAGHRFVVCEGIGDADYRETALPPGPERYRREFARRFLDGMPAQATLLREIIERERPDAIVAGSMFLGVLPLLLSDEKRPPIVICNVSFFFHDRPDLAPLGAGLPPAVTDAERAAYAAFGRQADAGFTAPVRAHADALLRGMGLPGLPASLTQSIILLPDTLLQMTVPAFEYDYGPLPRNVRFAGALPAPAVDAPLPDWWAELDGPRRVVLVTQGTLANGDFGELVEPTLRALAGRDDLLVVATTGGRPLDAVQGPHPSNARLATFLPFRELLPKVSALVTNGGYGTVSQALGFGVPVVAAGITEDKAEVGARVAWSGAGVNLAVNRPGEDDLRAAIDRTLDDPFIRRRAAALAAEFARYDAGREALAAIDALVERPALAG